MSRATPRASLVVQVGDDLYAIPCSDIETVVPLPHLRPVPVAPRALLGTFSYRGEIVPVIDLALALGGREVGDQLATRVVLSRTRDGLVGAVVSRVIDIRHLPRAERSLDVAHHPAVADPTLLDGRPIHLLALDRALSPELRGLVAAP